YTFTLGAYYQMFAGMKVLVRKGSMKRIPKTLPVLFTAGSDDPVGAFGKNVIRVYEKYKDAGIKDVSIHLYKGDRHEILNEVDRQNVYQDILAWIEEKNRR
ncbi:MAG: alpha/beta hydrolase, partial [Dorea sp.]|nr:alpha/beta hydrolase [Dorea sp.]